MHSPEHNRKFILGIGIDDISLNDAVSRCASFLHTGTKAVVVTPNPEICVFGYSRKWFRKIVEEADLTIPDGVGLKLGGAIVGQTIRNRTTGIDLTRALLDLAEHKNYSVLFLGGDADTGARLLQTLKNSHPALEAHYLYGGVFSSEGESDDPDIFKKINAVSPHLLFVCLGHPKQELFMLRNRSRIAAGIMLGVGGAIDFLAGEVARAPRWMRSIGLEWLFRLIVEPWRLKRIITATIVFPLYCLAWVWGTWFVYRKNVAAVIMNDQDEILICKHAIYKYWQIPQGGVMEGESYEDAMRRELQEEIGTQDVETIGWKKNAYTYRWPRHSRNFYKYKNRGQVQTVFLMRYRGAKTDIILDPTEFSECTWMTKDAILQSSLIPDYKKTVINIGLSLKK